MRLKPLKNFVINARWQRFALFLLLLLSAYFPVSVQLYGQGLGATDAKQHNQEAIWAFEGWIRNYMQQAGGVSSDSINEGISLAKQRREAFCNLIKADPAKALKLSVSSQIRSKLPSDIIAQLEMPVSGIGDFIVFEASPHAASL